MESQEGKNSNLSDASSAKYNIQVGPALWASCAKNRFFFPVPKQLGRNGVLPGNHRFLSFRHWLLVKPLEWNKIRISGDLSSPLTRYRLSLCRRLLPNGIIVRSSSIFKEDWLLLLLLLHRPWSLYNRFPDCCSLLLPDLVLLPFLLILRRRCKR